MKPALFTFSLAFALSAFAATPRVEFAASADRVGCYDFVEVTLHVAQPTGGNPFTDVTVAGTFGLSGETPIAVDGFCDSADGRVFRIRFMPAKPGAYDYTVTYREGGFAQQHRGQFQAVDQRNRGLVRLDPEYPSHFQWEGTQERFFWNGTTAYFLAGWDDATIRDAIERLDLHKITRIRAALAGRVADGRTWFEPVEPSDKFTFRLEPWVAANSASLEQPGFDVSRFNVGYWQKWEKLLAETRARDMAVSVVFYVDGSRPGVDPFGKSGMGGVDEQRYYRYAIARFGAYANVMWDLANEYRLFRDDAWAERMGAFVKQADPYDHLTSTHGHDDFRFRKSPWADFALHQSWDEHGGYDFMLKNRREQEQTGRVIPQINEEYGYEDHYPQGWGESRTAPARSAETRARLAWEICLAGGYQTTGERANSEHGGGWLNGRGDDSMTMLERYGHLYDFFTGIRWWELEPAVELVSGVVPHPKAPAHAAPRVFAARNPNGDLAAIYVRDGGIVTIKSDLLKDQLKPLWFSPRDGGMRNARMLRAGGYRTPTAEDWVLLFRTPCNCSFRDFGNEFEP
ncbi:DUF5060 domain-containing protein [Opitutus terrae]|uniref:DUF5060 domain-containing protein n=1 Tax=Opitutus terrae (strain DSM 11246 / JCM 15787 / PB90-1) TaxID=452637 RepID=B1ZY81_OPITP|nr:DUF5060 domain-containing protein [Opitutus terrae]ACB76227.1 hypothetical protein Oter_2946 [Opitutus terrae PB90-1]